MRKENKKFKIVKSKSGKVYTYDASKYYTPSRRGYTLVGKDGKITPNSKKNVKEFEEWIKNSNNYTENEKTTMINDLRALISQRKGKKKLTTTGFLGHLEGKKKDNRIKVLLSNAGYSAEELAKEISTETKPITENDILNPKNWTTETEHESRFGNETLGYWAISFTYTGSLLEKI